MLLKQDNRWNRRHSLCERCSARSCIVDALVFRVLTILLVWGPNILSEEINVTEKKSILTDQPMMKPSAAWKFFYLCELQHYLYRCHFNCTDEAGKVRETPHYYANAKIIKRSGVLFLMFVMAMYVNNVTQAWTFIRAAPPTPWCYLLTCCIPRPSEVIKGGQH